MLTILFTLQAYGFSFAAPGNCIACHAFVLQLVVTGMIVKGISFHSCAKALKRGLI